jgi:hypothetical protein
MDSERGARMEAKLDRIADDIGEIKVIQAKHHEQLEYHIKRTNLLEEIIRPIIEFMAMIKGVSKFIGLIALGAGIAEGIVALLEYLGV